MKKNSPSKAGKKRVGAPDLNVSVHRGVVDATRDFLSAVIVEFIHYWFTKNDKKPVLMKLDWMHEKLPYISRSGLAKRLVKLEKDGRIVVKRGEGRHYHKCWYSASADMREICNGRAGLEDAGKVYFNLNLAKENLEASVVYATIVNILKSGEEALWQRKTGFKTTVKLHMEGGKAKLLLDNKKLVEGSGLSLNKVRKAVRWLIVNKKIEAKTVFGNKRLVCLPEDTKLSSEELPTESYPHFDPAEEEPTEAQPHSD